MKTRRILYLAIFSAFWIFVAALPLHAQEMGHRTADSARTPDVGVQAGMRLSPITIEQSLVGVRIDNAPYVITPKGGFGISDQKRGDTLTVFTLGCGLDYYLSDAALKPYVGGDVFLDLVDGDDSDTSLSIAPHIGAEYRLNKNFSVGADVGVQMGFGDLGNSEFRFGTVTAFHATYYFGAAE
ncbi:MAG: hypothetical protein ACQERN_07935 [Thermodesulfobacteriota bacterium]